jgi:hypothetical protein
MMDIAVRDLPDPDSPTSPSGAPGVDRERDPVDGGSRPAGDGGQQLLHLQESHVSLRFRNRPL